MDCFSMLSGFGFIYNLASNCITKRTLNIPISSALHVRIWIHDKLLDFEIREAAKLFLFCRFDRKNERIIRNLYFDIFFLGMLEKNFIQSNFICQIIALFLRHHFQGSISRKYFSFYGCDLHLLIEFKLLVCQAIQENLFLELFCRVSICIFGFLLFLLLVLGHARKNYLRSISKLCFL